jgi:hypothetical protein
MASRPPDENEEQARGRWMIIQLTRTLGFAFVILGILMTRDVVDLFGESNHLVAYGFIVIGLLDGFLMPTVLARKWSSRER